MLRKATNESFVEGETHFLSTYVCCATVASYPGLFLLLAKEKMSLGTRLVQQYRYMLFNLV